MEMAIAARLQLVQCASAGIAAPVSTRLLTQTCHAPVHAPPFEAHRMCPTASMQVVQRRICIRRTGQS